MLPATTNVVGNFRLCNLVPRALQKTHQPKTRGFFNSYCGVPWGTDMYQCIFPYVYNIVYIYIYIYNYIHYVPYESYMICVPILFLHIHPTFSHENLPFLGGPDLAWRPGLRRWGGDQGLDLLRFSAEN
jgi:hypothetical protein